MTHCLDNPIWNALANHHSSIALGDDFARRYPPDVSPFGAVRSNELEAFDHLAQLIPSGESVVLVGVEPPIGDVWRLNRNFNLVQMIYDQPIIESAAVEYAITDLAENDVPAMLQLVDLTHPGPFAQKTIQLGHYIAIWQDGQLAAMAGQRFHPAGYREISAVCTHPNFQRRGYARQLISLLIHEIQCAGETPFLHVFGENAGAIALYKSMGFTQRAILPLFAVTRQ